MATILSWRASCARNSRNSVNETGH
jgi:hypothetical protein